MFSEEKLSQSRQKRQQSIGIQSFYSNRSYVLEYKKLREQIVYENVHKKKNQSRKDQWSPNDSEF